MAYRHVQHAPAMYLISGLGAVGAAAGLGWREELAGGYWIYQIAMLLLIVTGVVAARLTVIVDDAVVTTSFGWGWPRRSIDLNEVTNASQVRNSWWSGWGLRKVSRGWMYNNAGRDAIELTMRSGKVFRIGTDEPVELLAAITEVR